MTEQQELTYDVVVVGGGAAGLSGALTLARARRSVLVIDAGEPRNAPADGVHNYLGREGTPPGELLAAGRAEVASYGGEVRAGTVAAAARRAGEDGGFRLTLADGSVVDARRLLVATGLVDDLPDVPGLAEQWGRGVHSCPYCHGWEVRDQALGVLATGPGAVGQALLFRQWSADVTLFLHTAPEPAAEQAEQLAARGIRVVPGEVAVLETTDGAVTGVRLRSGMVFARNAVVVQPQLHARSAVLAELGLEAEPLLVTGRRVGTRLPADPAGATSVPGVWVAGNATDLISGVIGAAAAGFAAAAAINADLVAADTDLAVAAARPVRGGHRHGTGAGSQPSTVGVFTAEAWDERYGSSGAVWSGNVNPQLVAEAAGLAPGVALDLGSGEGADALWLAGRGWHVTALDVSQVALDRGAAQAARAGAGLAQRIEWVQADLLDWTPPDATFDLVSAQFMHMPQAALRQIYASVATRVATGGTLLVVGHHPMDLDVPGLRAHFPELMLTPDEIADLLDPRQWRVVVAQARARTVEAPGEHEGVLAHDAVVLAERR